MQEQTVTKEKDLLTLESDSKEIGFVFYPGAKVEYTAYLPLLSKLQKEGINCYLVKMPFQLAFFDANAADDVIEAHPEIDTWYMGGHSLGGAFASSYASKHAEKISGVVLLGAYLYGEYPVEQSLTIYGSNDQVLHRDKITYDTNVVVIDGGNHAQFGDYGAQKGDGDATISGEEQLKITVSEIVKFMRK